MKLPEKIEQIKKYTKNITILYVEDDPVARETLYELLQDVFDNIILAKDGEEAFEKFQKQKIDLVITDIMLPKLNGLDLIKKIKDIHNETHVIIISQHNESDILLKSIKLNVDGYILKPIIFKNFIDMIEKLTDKFKLDYESKNYQLYLSQYLSIMEKSNIISKTDTHGNITYVNDNFCKISGYSKKECIGQQHNITKHPDNPEELYQDMWHTIKEKKQTWEGMVKNRSKEGKSYYVKTIITPILDLEGEIVEYIAVRDNLNSIINDKKYLFEQIDKNELSILVLLEIDEFDMLDKFYNLITVDQVEKNFAFNLLGYLPKSYKFENVYTLGEGRYALLTEFNKFDQAQLNLKEYLEQFVQNVKDSTLKFDEMEFDLNITVSYAIGKHMLYEDAKAGLEQALQQKTKLNYANDFSIAVSQAAKENLDVIKMVKIALENYNIVSYFQPIINNKNGKIEKYESLVRLIDEKGTIISPFAFLNISKTGNYYNKITERVLENSFKILHKITTKLSINISALDIEKGYTREKIFELLEEYKEDNERIVFELLEDENVKDFKTIKEFIQTVKQRGVKIAIDDFGAGYSNFERLLEFEPDILKIDGSLIKNIENDQFSRNIVETIVLFAQKQNIETIAEYVENEKIFNILNDLGVDYSQGYYFSKPIQEQLL